MTPYELDQLAQEDAALADDAPIPMADSDLCALIDRELFRFGEIWAAAGHPHGVFQLSPDELVRLTAAPVADVVVPA